MGVNCFTKVEEENISILKVDEGVQKAQIHRLKELKSRRDNSKAGELLDKLVSTVANRNNLMPAILEAVKGSVTLGEICDTLRVKFGVYKN